MTTLEKKIYDVRALLEREGRGRRWQGHRVMGQREGQCRLLSSTDSLTTESSIVHGIVFAVIHGSCQVRARRRAASRPSRSKTRWCASAHPSTHMHALARTSSLAKLTCTDHQRLSARALPARIDLRLPPRIFCLALSASGVLLGRRPQHSDAGRCWSLKLPFSFRPRCDSRAAQIVQ
eukprot:852717-Pleurochrysis_carterae.AAC.2